MSAFHSALGEEEQNAAVATFKLVCDSCNFSRILFHEKCEQSVFTPQGHNMAWDCVVLHVELETKESLLYFELRQFELLSFHKKL